MARVYTNGFELNSATSGVEFDTVSGATISSSTVRTGTYSGRISSLVSATPQYFYFPLNVGGLSQVGYYRFYFRVATAPSAESAIFLLSNSGFLGSRVYMTLGSDRKLRWYGNGTASSALSLNTWYRVEVYSNGGTAPDYSEAHTTVRVDGVDFYDAADGGVTFFQAYFGGNLQSEAVTTGDWFFDDIAINDTTGANQSSWPGAGNVIVLRPNADGDNTDIGGVSGYLNVDEVTPDGDTTEINSNAVAVNSRDDYNLSASGLTNSTVTLVQVNYRARGGSSTTSHNDTANIRLKATASGTVTSSGNIQPFDNNYYTNDDNGSTIYPPITAYFLPGTSTAWTPTTLNSAQIGWKKTVDSSSGFHMTAMWLTVDYVSLEYPTVTTQAASSVTPVAATGNGNITAIGGEAPDVRGIVYSTSTQSLPGNVAPDASGYSLVVSDTGTFSTGAFTEALTGLSLSTTYYARAYAHNTDGYSYGGEVNFTTGSAPTVTTQAVSSIATLTATGNGNVTSAGSGTVSERGVVWSTSHNPTTSDNKAMAAAGGTGAFTASITGLVGKTTYYVRAYGINEGGTSYGSEVSFTTLGFTNPTNAYSSDNNYATVVADSGTIAISLSGDGGSTYTSELSKTFTGVEGSQTYGNGSTELWGRSWTGDDVDDTSFRVYVRCGSLTWGQIYKTYGFAISASATLTGIEVSVEAKWNGTTTSIDHVKVKIYYGTSVVIIAAGAQAYNSTLNKLSVYTGAAWETVLSSSSFSAAAPNNATYIVQTASTDLSAEQALGALATGIVKNTTTTGVLSIATEGTDYYKPGGTDVAVADGGTGASTLTGILLGSGTSAITGLDAGVLSAVRTYFNSDSPATWSKPSGVRFVIVEVQAGGGGGGGGANAGASSSSQGLGGGAGGYSKKKIAAASLGSTETVTIGVAGTAGASGNNAGGAGGNSSFGAHATANGGGAGGGGASSATVGATPSAAGGTAASGDINIGGQDGFPKIRFTGVAGTSGGGGNSQMGKGGQPVDINLGGQTGFGYGAGGSGGQSSAAGGAQTGGAGTQGVVIVYEYL